MWKILWISPVSSVPLGIQLTVLNRLGNIPAAKIVSYERPSYSTYLLRQPYKEV
jgi:hypothetical protein